MKKLFSNLFGKKSAPMPTTTVNPNMPTQDLFTERKGTEHDPKPQQEPQAPIQAFLSQDFISMGEHCGYRYHSTDILQSELQVVKHEFAELLTREQNRVANDLLELDNTLQTISEDLFPEQYRKLLNLKERMLIYKASVDAEVELCHKGFGKVERALDGYKLGFQRGLHVWSGKTFSGVRYDSAPSEKQYQF